MMSNRTKLGLNVLEAALLLGVLGDALLRQTPWGLNVLLWTGALILAMSALHARYGEGRRASWRADGGWLIAPILFCAAAFAWRDSTTLKVLDGLALFVACALLAWRARGHKIRLASLGDYALGLGHAGFDALFASLPLVLSDVQWATIPRGGAMRHAWAAARGLVIAVPLLFIFGALFMAADAVFEGIMRQTFQLDGGVLFSHLFLVLLFTWLVGGFLRGMMLTVPETASEILPAVPPAYTSITIDDKERKEADTATRHDGEANEPRRQPESVVVEDRTTTATAAEGSNKSKGDNNSLRPDEVDEISASKGEAQTTGTHAAVQSATQTTSSVTSPETAAGASQGFGLGAVEVGIVLGLLNVLFACFVVVQFRYFFGGAARVMSITELTYAEYARRGFFELTWVAGLLLPLLLIIHALLRRKDRQVAERIFRPLAGTQVALLFVIMASAIGRMRLYQSEYGLTELRLYTTAFMLWLGLVFVWFLWTVVIRSRRERFACGALVAAFLTVGLLHLANPDAYIVRANIAHAARAGRAFDAEYAATLSADAVPALVSALPSLSREERCLVAREVTGLWSQPAPGEDWRAWSLARSRARRAVSAHQESLREAACPPLTSIHVAPPVSAPTTPPPLVSPPSNSSPAGGATDDAAAANTTTTNTTSTPATTGVETMSMKTEPKGAITNSPKSMQQTRSGIRRKVTTRKQARGGQRARAR